MIYYWFWSSDLFRPVNYIFKELSFILCREAKAGGSIDMDKVEEILTTDREQQPSATNQLNGTKSSNDDPYNVDVTGKNPSINEVPTGVL